MVILRSLSVPDKKDFGQLEHPPPLEAFPQLLRLIIIEPPQPVPQGWVSSWTSGALSALYPLNLQAPFDDPRCGAECSHRPGGVPEPSGCPSQLHFLAREQRGLTIVWTEGLVSLPLARDW